MREQLFQLEQTAVFAPFDAEHGVINNTVEWNASIVQSTPLPDAIGAWYRDPCQSMFQLIEVP
ncbi:hypothetical protein POL68_27320 [Stigmatella sp. ncwal1]|uniref:Uncharacterized protein n=1 Tax=Stigmatella ashevillensis TaxID=2995309 RepID=A0ABT5DF23_9BACT|nr:hypothetical protein [Stigmatella ashevillena]MDC0712208.1 hypothetical protein [Stigmatella ashevillena]